MAWLGLGLAVVCWLAFWSGERLAEADGDEGVFEYGDGPRGPANWGELEEAWRACGEGRAQSPVAILAQHAVADKLCRLSLRYAAAPAHLSIRTHDVAIEWRQGGAGGVLWDKQEYNLLQLHLHSPSEHTINGFKYPLEAHRVHEGPEKNLLVVSILYEYGKEDATLAYLMEEFPYLHGSGKADHLIGNISLSGMKIGKQYYHYMGSLTTPPCKEGVTWIIMKKKHTVSKEQVDEIIKAELGENARPEQPLNGRTIYKYSMQHSI